MERDKIVELAAGTILEGPHWTEPVKVLAAKTRGSRIEVQAVGTVTKRLWTKLLRPKEFGETIKVTGAGKLAALDGNPTVNNACSQSMFSNRKLLTSETRRA